MQYDAAVQGGEIARQIAELNKLIADFDAMKGAGANFSGQASIYNGETGNLMLTFPSLSAPESAALFDGAKAIFQARVDALNAQLAGL